MNTLILILNLFVLPWHTLFVNEKGFGEEVVWAAKEISGLDVNYRQGSRAGIWGLTPEVAQAYGLRVDKWIDERYDVKRSSEVVAAYFDALIEEYGNDTLRALMVLVNTPYRQVGDKGWVTPGRCRREASESQVAMLRREYEKEEGEKAEMYARADSLMAVERQMKREEQAKAEKAAASAKKESKVSTNGVHVVRSGETLSHIAQKYHCTVSMLKKWNNLKSDLLQIGQKLKVRK